MPARNDPDREIEADDRVHGKHQRRGQSRQQQIGHFVTMPVSRRTAPTHCQHPINDLKGLATSAIAQRGKVGDQTNKPEHRRDSGVGGDSKDVPHQRAAKLRPDAHRVGIGKQPVSQPGTAQVHNRIHAGLGYGKQGHRFRKTINGRAPLLPEQEQNCRDQRARMTDSDPPDEIQNIHSPGDRNVDTPKPNAFEEELRNRQEHQLEEDKRDRKPDEPAGRCFPLQHDRADLVGHRSKRQPRCDNRCRRVNRTFVVWFVWHSLCPTNFSLSFVSANFLPQLLTTN